jgi:hypothetical protein
LGRTGFGWVREKMVNLTSEDKQKNHETSLGICREHHKCNVAANLWG